MLAQQDLISIAQSKHRVGTIKSQNTGAQLQLILNGASLASSLLENGNYAAFCNTAVYGRIADKDGRISNLNALIRIFETFQLRFFEKSNLAIRNTLKRIFSYFQLSSAPIVDFLKEFYLFHS